MIFSADDLLELVLINYESIFRPEIRELLEAFRADIIILDEAHYIKNYTAKVSKEAYELGDRAKYRLLLTGTPLTNRQTDLYGEFRFVDSTIFGKNFYAFRNRYCVMGGFQGKAIIGERNKDELIRKVHSAALRVTKDRALDLPEETTIVRHIELSKAERGFYDQLRKDGIAELEGAEASGEITAPRVITKLLRLHQVCGGFVRMDGDENPIQIGTSKLDALKEILIDAVQNEGNKLVIFALFVPEVKAICSLLDDLGIRHVCIYGAVPQEERGQLVEQFQTDPEVQVIVLQLATAGLGITLHAASTAVFYSKDSSAAHVEQAKARIHRMGQRHPCTYIDLIASDTYDERVEEIIDGKLELSDDICNNWRRFFYPTEEVCK